MTRPETLRSRLAKCKEKVEQLEKELKELKKPKKSIYKKPYKKVE